MKIRAGFVSNSSSTSYVVAIDRNFRTTQEKMQEFLDEVQGWEVDCDTLEEADEIVGRIIEELCSDGEVFIDHEGPDGIESFLKVFNEITIECVDVGPEDGRCVNILSDKDREMSIKQLRQIVENYDTEKEKNEDS